MNFIDLTPSATRDQDLFTVGRGATPPDVPPVTTEAILRIRRWPTRARSSQSRTRAPPPLI